MFRAVIGRSAGDEAIHTLRLAPWIASLALAMTRNEGRVVPQEEEGCGFARCD